MPITRLPGEARAASRLRRLPAFAANTAHEIAFIQQVKVSELAVSAGWTASREGQVADRVFTLLTGWAFRGKTLPDGRRLILNFLLPGIWSACRQSCSPGRAPDSRH